MPDLKVPAVGWHTGMTGTLTEMQNPVTRSIVKVVPPQEITEPGQVEDLVRRFNAYCAAAWDLGHMDPDVVDLTYIARASNPADAARAIVRHLACAQHKNAAELLKAVEWARSAGVTWREIGDDTGLPYATVFRQAQAESPIVVVRPRHLARDAEGE